MMQGYPQHANHLYIVNDVVRVGEHATEGVDESLHIEGGAHEVFLPANADQNWG